MEPLLIEQNPHWSGNAYEISLPRAVLADLLPKFALEEILVLQGIRRCGKSTLFSLLINHLLQTVDPKSILYINLDDPTFTTMQESPEELRNIVETATKLTGSTIEYLFLDEIQTIIGWEKYVKSVYDSKVFKKIAVTGSNSSLLAGQYASLLTGRYIKQQIYPLGFGEILHSKAVHDHIKLIKQKPHILALIENIMSYGTYPKVYLNDNDNLKREQLISYYEAIIYKDCIKNHDIRNIKTFVELAHYILSNPGCRFSYNKIANSLSCADSTIKEYVNILEQSYLITELNHFSFSLHKQEKSAKKYYIADNGLITANAFQFIEVWPRLFENLVFTELQKKYGDNVYFYHDLYECDFIINNHKQLIGIQVCYNLTDENKNREIRGITYSREKLKFEKGYIITMNQEEQLTNDIAVMPFWKFFSEPYF